MLSSSPPAQQYYNTRGAGAARSKRSNNPFLHHQSYLEPSIWATRHVDWPLATQLPGPVFAKLLKASRLAGQQLGILVSKQHVASNPNHPQSTKSNTSASSASSTPVSIKKKSGGSEEKSTTTEESSYFSGFMNRVLNTSSSAHSASHHTVADEWLEAERYAEQNNSKTLRAPRAGCVAAANGWIVAATECPISNSNNHISLRLVSRWNVRRANMSAEWVALPPPVSSNNAGGSHEDSRIVHVFVDPTGSHILLSSANGEAYAMHSQNSNKQAYKLTGFGRNADGAWPSSLTGIPATMFKTPTQQQQQQQVQKGLSANSYVTAVAWDKDLGTEGSTKSILLGTSAGEIYEYCLSNTSNNETANTQPPTLLHKLYRDTSTDPSEVGAAVTGIYVERLRTGLLVIVSTSGRHKRTRLYTFYSAHSSNFNMVLSEQHSLQELPGSVDFADLRICNDHFALRTQTGIYYGTIDRALSGPAVLSGGSSLIIDSGILPYDSSTSVVSLALTPHHIVSLTENFQINFINRVAQKVIQTERLDIVDDSMLMGGVGEFLMDIRRPDQIWLRRGRSLIHISSSSQEDRDVWKYTLQKCLAMPDDEKAQEVLFEQAKTLCTNATQKAVVTAVRGEYHLKQGRGELAAKYLAQCPAILEPFSDTAIRLGLPKLGIDDPLGYGGSWRARSCLENSNIPLVTYLNDKMRIGSSNDDKMTCTMLGAWLTELFLHERGEQLTNAAVHEEPRVGTQEIESTQKALLAQFLNANVNTMDAKTIMKILTSHDVGATECSLYAAKSGDITTAVNAALSAGQQDSSGAFDALRILNEARFELAEPLYYRHASVFLARSPAAAGESFLSRYSDGLSPMRLLPAIMNYEKTRLERARVRKAYEASRHKDDSGGVEETKSAIECVGGPNESPDGFELKIDTSLQAVSFVEDSSVVMKYLEGVIQRGCRNGAVFRYLMSLYVAMEDEEPLCNFLSNHVPAATTSKKAMLEGDRHTDDTTSTPLDMSFALRAVLGSGRHFRSAIKLYMGFGMRQQAVELALRVDPSLARQLAQGSVEPDERKRLWLMIAKSAATDGSSRGGKDVVSRVVSVLKDCGDSLSIEDVLPFLPDFAQIDQIKDEICEALTSYSSKIEAYLREMNECDELCDNVRKDITRLRNHHMRVRADASCALTDKRVLEAGEAFYAFPSGYVFLASALKSEVYPFLNKKQQERVDELENLLQVDNGDESKQTLQSELDGILASECPLTGSIMVDSIDKGFQIDEFVSNEVVNKNIDRIDV